MQHHAPASDAGAGFHQHPRQCNNAVHSRSQLPAAATVPPCTSEHRSVSREAGVVQPTFLPVSIAEALRLFVHFEAALDDASEMWMSGRWLSICPPHVQAICRPTLGGGVAVRCGETDEDAAWAIRAATVCGVSTFLLGSVLGTNQIELVRCGGGGAAALRAHAAREADGSLRYSAAAALGALVDAATCRASSGGPVATGPACTADTPRGCGIAGGTAAGVPPAPTGPRYVTLDVRASAGRDDAPHAAGAAAHGRGRLYHAAGPAAPERDDTLFAAVAAARERQDAQPAAAPAVPPPSTLTTKQAKRQRKKARKAMEARTAAKTAVKPQRMKAAAADPQLAKRKRKAAAELLRQGDVCGPARASSTSSAQGGAASGADCWVVSDGGALSDDIAGAGIVNPPARRIHGPGLFREAHQAAPRHCAVEATVWLSAGVLPGDGGGGAAAPWHPVVARRDRPPCWPPPADIAEDGELTPALSAGGPAVAVHRMSESMRGHHRVEVRALSMHACM